MDSTSEQMADQLKRLQGYFASSPDDAQAGVYAHQMLACDAHTATHFLLEQARAGGRLANAAMAALRSAGATAGPHLVDAIEASPDDPTLAHALPCGLSRRLVKRLLGVLPRVGDPLALRFLTQLIAESGPPFDAELAAFRASLTDPSLATAFTVAKASAGDETALGELRAALSAETDGRAVRLLLSCAPLARTEEASGPITRLLASELPEDRVHALALVQEHELWAHSAAVVMCFLREDVGWVSERAESALPTALQYVDIDDAVWLMDRAARMPDAPASVGGRGETVVRWARRCGDLLGRAQIVASYGLCNQRIAEVVLSGAALAANAALSRLKPYLLDDAASEALVAACEAALETVARIADDVWVWNRRSAVELHAYSSGLVAPGSLCRPEQVPDGLSLPALMDDLAHESAEGARLFLDAYLLDPARMAAARMRVGIARNALKRARLLARMLSCDEAQDGAAAELGRSYEREAKACALAEGMLSSAGLSAWQAAFDRRAALIGRPEALSRGLSRRTAREVQPPVWETMGLALFSWRDPLERVFAEQVLQADLLTLLGACPSVGGAVPALVHALGARSSVARGRARDALRRRPSMADALLTLLDGAPTDSVRAQAIELLRCFGDPRVLQVAGEALRASDELLQATAARAAGSLGTSAEFGARLTEMLVDGDTPELAALAAVQAVVDLLGPDQRKAEFLVSQLGRLPASLRPLLSRRLCECPDWQVLPALERATRSTSAYTRVCAQQTLLDMDSGGWWGAPPGAGLSTRLLDDPVLAQELMLEGDGPWQWGMPALQVASLHEWPTYAGTLHTDDALAARWEFWQLTGMSPDDLLPSLQTRASAGGAGAAEAVALGLEILSPELRQATEGFVRYQGLEPSEDLAAGLRQTAAEVLCRCTPGAVARLAPRNPSHSGRFDLLMPDRRDPDARGARFATVFSELLKTALRRRYGRRRECPAIRRGEQFRLYVEEEWSDLLEYQDVLYGFTVDPRLGLGDLAVYCADRRADPTCRTQIASYLAYLATTSPVLAERRNAAIKALRAAHRPQLLRAARRVAAERRRHGHTAGPPEDRQALRAAQDDVGERFVRALREFAVHWPKPVPQVFLGALGMAWEPFEKGPSGQTSPYPERHLSFANLVKAAADQAVREARAQPSQTIATVSLDQPAEGHGERGGAAIEVGQTVREAGEKEDALIDGIDSGQPVEDLVSDALGRDEPSVVQITTRTLVRDGQPVECVDIRGAAELLGRSEKTLRRHDKAGDLPFLWEDGYRYLPLDEVETVRVVLRKPGEWAERLGVSAQTVRKWLNEMPEDTPPLELDERLREKKAAMRGQG